MSGKKQLLNEVLESESLSEIREGALALARTALRERRRRFWRRSAIGAFAAAASVAIVLSIHLAPPSSERVSVPSQPLGVASGRPTAFPSEQRAEPRFEVVRSRSAASMIVHTRPSSIEVLDDKALLAELADRSPILVTVGPGKKRVVLALAGP